VTDQELLAKASGALAPAADPAAALLDLGIRAVDGLLLAARRAAAPRSRAAREVVRAVLLQAECAKRDLRAWAHGPLGIGMTQDEAIGLGGETASLGLLNEDLTASVNEARPIQEVK